MSNIILANIYNFVKKTLLYFNMSNAKQNYLHFSGKFYVGVASVQYGKSYDIISLCDGNFDDSFMKNEVYFFQYCKIFEKIDDAYNDTLRRIVTDDSGYIIEMSVPFEFDYANKNDFKKNISEYVRLNGFSNFIVSAFNAESKKKVN